MNMTIGVTRLGSGHFAMTRLAGTVVRGNRASSEIDAVRNLFFKLANADVSSHDDEVLTLLELELAGTTLDEQLALTEGNGTPD